MRPTFPTKAWLVSSGLALLLLNRALGSAPADVRRDATVEAIEKVMPSVVNISTRTRREQRGYIYDWWRDMLAPFRQELPPEESAGSGVIIDEAGFVLTNVHVVEDADEIRVKVGDRVIPARVVTGTRRTDVALLKLQGKPADTFTPAQFAADDDLLLGETVVALGNPFGLGVSVSRGILSAKTRRDLTEASAELDLPDWLQTDAAINPGNSGGPLINLRGEVIGINVAILREGRGIGFAIPIKRVSEALAEIFTPEALAGLWFGAKIKAGKLPLRITEIMPDSPADQGGLREDDAILALDDEPVRSYVGLMHALVEAGESHPVSLRVQRGSRNLDLRVRCVPEASYFNADLIRRRTGLTVEQSDSGRGLRVTAVERNSPASRAGLERNMIVEAIEGQATADVVTAAKLLHVKKKGERVGLSILVPVQMGRLVVGSQETVELQVR